MSALVDGRPGGLDAMFRPGNTFTCRLTWPAGSLAGRTFVAALDLVVLAVSIIGDVLTVTVTEAQTLAAVLGEPGLFTLTETTGGVTEVLLAGRWVASDGPAASTLQDVTVTAGTANVAVTVSASDALNHQPNVVRPPGWGATWRSALAQASIRPVKVCVLSDSIGVGEIGTNWLTDGWVGLMKASLQATYGDGGSGFISHNYRAAGNPGGGQVTTTGAWTDVDNEGGLSKRSLKPTTPGNGATITMPVRGTSIDMWFRTDATFGTFHYQIDGGSFVAVPLNITAQVLKVSVSVSAGNHTVVVRATTGDGRFYGCAGRNATGVIVHNISVSGELLAQLGDNTTGITVTDPATNTMAYRSMQAASPVDLVILSLGINDVLLDVDDTTFRTNIWNALASLGVGLQAFGPNSTTRPELIVIAENVGDGDILSGFSQWERDWIELRSILAAYAEASGALFVDMWGVGRRTWAYWQSIVAWGNGNTDPLHPNDFGHQLYFNALAPSLVNP